MASFTWVDWTSLWTDDLLARPQSCLETILNNLDEQQTSKILQQVFEYVTTTVRANSSRVINGLVSALSAVLPGPTLAIFFPVCRDRILSELSFGASSTRTTSTTITVSSDATLHWYMWVTATTT